MEKREQVFVPALQDVGRSEEGAAWRFAGYQGRGWDGVTDGDGWNGGARYQGLVGLARVGVELSSNIIEIIGLSSVSGANEPIISIMLEESG